MNIRKAAIIGCGFVGSASAFSLMQSGLFSELVLIDVDRTRAEGEALDISHGLPFARPMQIYAGTYADLSDAAIVIVCAGAGQKPGETRLDLFRKNIEVFRNIIPQIAAVNQEAILLIVTNPVDVLTYAAVRFSGYPENRVFGTGTVLDTARLKYLLGQHLQVDPRSVHAFIIGEHGDSEIAAWSGASVSGVPLRDFCEMRGHFHAGSGRACPHQRIQDHREKAGHLLRHRHVGPADLRGHRPGREVCPAGVQCPTRDVRRGGRRSEHSRRGGKGRGGDHRPH